VKGKCGVLAVAKPRAGESLTLAQSVIGGEAGQHGSPVQGILFDIPLYLSSASCRTVLDCA